MSANHAKITILNRFWTGNPLRDSKYNKLQEYKTTENIIYSMCSFYFVEIKSAMLTPCLELIHDNNDVMFYTEAPKKPDVCY